MPKPRTPKAPSKAKRRPLKARATSRRKPAAVVKPVKSQSTRAATPAPPTPAEPVKSQSTRAATPAPPTPAPEMDEVVKEPQSQPRVEGSRGLERADPLR